MTAWSEPTDPQLSLEPAHGPNVDVDAHRNVRRPRADARTEARFASPVIDPSGLLVFVLASGPRWRSTLWALGPEGASHLGTSRLELACHPLPLADGGVCQIFDASRTRFFAMDTGAPRITPAASLPGRFFAGRDPHGPWMTGWYKSNLIAVRLSPADAIRVVGPQKARPQLIAASDRAVAGVWHQIGPASAMRVDPVYGGIH